MRRLRRGLDTSIRTAWRSETAPEWEGVVAEIRRRVARRCRRYELPAEERDEVEGDILTSLVETLRSHGPEAIRRFDPYVESLIDNLCKGRIRRRRPIWTRLKDEIVETLRGRRNARGFAVWKSAAGELAGYAAWNGRARWWTDRYLEMQTDLRPLEAHVRALGQNLSVAALLDAVFSWAGAPVPLHELTSTMFRLKQLREVQLKEIDERSESVATPESKRDDLALRETVDAIADALLALPPPECSAFLLHQKPEVVERVLLSLTPVEVKSVVERLQISSDGIDRLLEELPWSDLEIAEHLGIHEESVHRTQQRVINLRQRAIRGMQRFIGGLEGATRDLSERTSNRAPARRGTTGA